MLSKMKGIDIEVRMGPSVAARSGMVRQHLANLSLGLQINSRHGKVEQLGIPLMLNERTTFLHSVKGIFQRTGKGVQEMHTH